MKTAKLSNTSIGILVLLASASVAAEELSKLDVLKNYFSSGAYCSTAEVIEIEPNNTFLTIYIEIEPATRKALHKMPEDQRDDWFSLHCPPERHPVWAESTNDFDVTVEEVLTRGANITPKSSAQIDPTQTPQYSLSCSTYIAEQYNQRLSYREQVRLKIEKLLSR